MVRIVTDYWRDASCSDWRSHVIQNLDMGRELITDPDCTFLEATKVLSDAYLSLHGKRAAVHPETSDEHELEDRFWDLQRSSSVIDSLVGSVCIVLMRWMERVTPIVIGNLILLETKFPFESDTETEQAKCTRHRRSLMQCYGSKVRGRQVGGALAVWQIGNVFKHGSGELHNETKAVARQLGFSGDLCGVHEHEGEEELRLMALNEVAYTLGANSIERMALQLGCGPTTGLTPLYDHVESWRQDIDTKLRDAQEALKKLG